MTKPFYRVDKPLGIENRRQYRIINSIILAVFIIIIAVVLLLILNLNKISNPNVKSARGATIVKNIGGAKTFKSAYFEFSDTNNWVYAPNDSTPNKLTYLLYSGGVLAHSITVYVNQAPIENNLATTRVLPVSITNSDSFGLGVISSPCSTLYSSTDLKDIKPVSISGTSFLCVPDSPEYLVIVGQVGGNYNLSLRRSNGQIASYIIIYHNLAATDPNPQPFLDAMQTFKAL
jgi:hypothetical protein